LPAEKAKIVDAKALDHCGYAARHFAVIAIANTFNRHDLWKAKINRVSSASSRKKSSEVRPTRFGPALYQFVYRLLIHPQNCA
jgi:hypothetical protein